MTHLFTQLSLKLLAIICFVNFYFIGNVNSQTNLKNNYIELDSNQVLEEHKLDLPLGTISLNFSDVFDVDGKPMFFAYLYPQKSLFIYDLANDSLVREISSHNLEITKVEYFESDSIMIYGYPLYTPNNDSVIRCININGEIKHVYPVFHPNIVSSKKPPELLVDDKNEMYPDPKFIYDNKIFMTFNYPYYGLKGYSKKHPIIGYYDIAKDSLITIGDIWYPNLKEGVYYKRRFYKPDIALKENGNILISFSYTPLFYEWNYKTNKWSTHFVASNFVPSIPNFTTLFKNEDEYNDQSYNEGYVYGVNSLKYSTDKSQPNAVYSRSFLLPSLTIKGRKVVNVFYDENYRYCGEGLQFMPKKTYKRDYVNSYISKGKIVVRFVKPTFKPYNEIALIAKLDSVKKIDIENDKSKNNELCAIAGKNQSLFTYQKNDIISFLQKTQQIQDTSFAIAIINKSGCGPCNEYVLQFLKENQIVFFNIKTCPFYLLYVSEDGTMEDVETYLDWYRLFDKKHVKKEITSLYQNFNPHREKNPRLVIVSNNSVIFDEDYLPNNLEQFPSKIIDYYGLEAE